MNKISEQLLKAVDIIADKKVSQLEFDKTIEATIDSVVNLDSGEYKVRYKGNIFSAFSDDLDKTYKIDDSVFVIVPEGDFSKKKFITGSMSNRSLTYAQQMALQNSIFEISPTFESLYGGNLYDPVVSNEKGEYEREGYGVIAGAPPQERNKGYRYIYEGPENFQSNDGFHGLFQQYSNNYELIRIQASFMTQLQSAHVKGNYGLEVEFYAKDETGGVDTVSYKLDLNNFNGDPYRFSVYSPQYVIIKAQKNYLLGLKSIKLFEEGFEYDRIIKNGLVTTEENRTTPNIFVRDIKIQYVQVRDLTDTNYYLMIAAPQGIMLRQPNVMSLDLIGRLIYQGKDIMDVRPAGNISNKEQESLKCECKWFERDLSVMIGSDKYDKRVGFGWKPLDFNGSKLTVNGNNVKHQNRYKLLVIYNKTTFLTAEIEVFNYDSGYKYHIEQKTDKDNISLVLVNDIDDRVLQGDWYISYPDGGYQYLQVGNSVSVSPYLNYSSVIFYCAVHGIDNQIIGTLEHTIVNTESSEDLVVEYIGEDSFRYDANGDITIEDSERERTLQTRLTWNNNIGTQYTVNWVVRRIDGTELVLDGHHQQLPDSMIENLWVDNYNILHYTIRQKYRLDFQNNSVFVKVKLLTGETYLFQKEILFLKDGDQGTNGTTYVIAIRPCDRNGDKLSGFNPLVYRNGHWQEDLQLRCYVYRDGELISKRPSPGPDFTIRYKWSAQNVTLSSDTSDQVTASGMGTIDYSDSRTCQFYVKVQVSINDHTTERETEIYASYPLDVVDGNINIFDVDISGIPSYIKYTSSGLTPQFYRDPIKLKYQDNEIKGEDKIISLNKHVLDLEKDKQTNEWYLKPAASFIFENIKENRESNIGVLRCKLGSNLNIIHPIIMYLDVYGNEAINGWDGTALDMGKEDENGKHQYLFAPQVGAGGKDNQNRFTGVVMGKDSSQDMIGLYGYQAGLNTFGLLQNGKAYFGAKSGGGQIVLDGRYATIFGGDVTLNETSGKINPAANGMYIRLADNKDADNDEDKVKNTIKAIGIGWSTHKDENGRDQTEENFFVTYDGKVRATEANIHGKIYAYEGQIGGTARQGGWTIKKNRLYSGSSSNSYVELNSAPMPNTLVNPGDLSESNFAAIWAGKDTPGTSYTKTQNVGSNNVIYGDITSPASFVVTKDGFLYAENAKIAGYISSKGGDIGGWTINKTSITSSNGKVGMASSGNAAFWVGNGLNSDSNSIPDSQSDTKFLVTRSGKLYCSSANISGRVTAESGQIGGWKITKTRLQSSDGTVWLSATGGLTLGSNFSVTTGGIVEATGANIQGTVIASAGSIGGWTINDNALVNGSTRLNANGSIYCENASIKGTIQADTGYIGSWNITDNSIVNGTTRLNSDGSIRCENVNIEGTINALNFTCSNGTIGGWTISETNINNGIIQLNAGTTEEENYRDINGAIVIQGYGRIGYVDSSTQTMATTGVGIKAEGAESEIVATSGGVRMTFGSRSFTITQSGFWVNGKKLTEAPFA